MARRAKEKETKAITSWPPFMDLTRWEKMERMMDDFFGRRRRSWWLGRSGA